MQRRKPAIPADEPISILEGVDMVKAEPAATAAAPAKPKRKRKKGPAVVVEAPNHDEAEEWLSGVYANLNHSEAVEVARLIGIEVDRSIPRTEIVDMLLAGKQDSSVTSRIWGMRHKVQDFLDRHPMLGVNPKACPRNCALHHDMIVMQCYRHMATLIATDRSSRAVERAKDNIGKMGRRVGIQSKESQDDRKG